MKARLTAWAQALGPVRAAFIGSLLLSFVAVQGHLVNRDGIYYLETARAILEGGLMAGWKAGEWAFLPTLIAALAFVTKVSPETAAHGAQCTLHGGHLRAAGRRHPPPPAGGRLAGLPRRARHAGLQPVPQRDPARIRLLVFQPAGVLAGDALERYATLAGCGFLPGRTGRGGAVPSRGGGVLSGADAVAGVRRAGRPEDAARARDRLSASGRCGAGCRVLRQRMDNHAESRGVLPRGRESVAHAADHQRSGQQDVGDGVQVQVFARGSRLHPVLRIAFRHPDEVSQDDRRLPRAAGVPVCEFRRCEHGWHPGSRCPGPSSPMCWCWWPS